MKKFLKKTNRGIILSAICLVILVIYVSVDFITFSTQKDTIRQTTENYINDALKTTIPYYKVTMKDGTVHWFYSNIEFINSIDIGGFDGEDFYCSAGIDGLRIDVNGRVIRVVCQMC